MINIPDSQYKYNSSFDSNKNIYDLSQYSNVIKFNIKDDNNLKNKLDYNNNDIKNDLGINNYSKYEEVIDKDGSLTQTISQTITNYERIQDNYINDFKNSDTGKKINEFGNKIGNKIEEYKDDVFKFIKTYFGLFLITLIIYKKL